MRSPAHVCANSLKTLGFVKETYDIRSIKGGVAVSGEVILHQTTVYIQVGQSVLNRRWGVLIRRCDGRQDYEGGRNHFVPLAMLDDLPALADYVRRVLAEPGGEG